MNKRSITTAEEDKLDVHKRHRKHKHKSKHKKHGIKIPVFSSGSTSVTLQTLLGVDDDDDDDEDVDDVDGDDVDQTQQESDGELVFVEGTDTAPSTSTRQLQQQTASSGLKLKFKLGGQTLGETSVAIVHETDEENQLIEVVDDVPAVASDISDEDAWLDALESGKLDEYDEMRRMKDPALMTARQKALLESKTQLRQPAGQQLQPEYLMLPLGYKEKEMTEEMIQKRELKAKKRRQQAQEKREKDKIQTIDRLLKKQESKPKGSKARMNKKTAQDVPKFTYISNRDMCAICVPIGYSFGMQPSKSVGTMQQRPTVVLCGVPHCTNPKRYSCSRTGVPLCSLECYKTNLASQSTRGSG